MSLFQLGNFVLHSGQKSNWKISCDFLTRDDWDTLAAIAVERLPAFGSVEGVTRGGWEFAGSLRSYCTRGPLLIADDVLTTGRSMEELRAGRKAIGVVVFARGPCLPWVVPLFSLTARFSGGW